MEKISNFAQKKVFGKRRIIKIFLRIENSRLTSIFRRALMMLVPIIIVGAVAYAMLNFPNKAVEYLITDRYEEIAIFLEIVYMATFGMFSMMLVVALAISYAMEHNKTIDKISSKTYLPRQVPFLWHSNKQLRVCLQRLSKRFS